MTIKLKSLVFIAFLTLSFSCIADQAAYIDKADAEQAKYLLDQASAVKSYCAPCGDQVATMISVQTVEVVFTNYENYWEVQINGEGIDLAYTYLLMGDNRWKNVAMELNIPVKGVPEFIN